jgi:hypothetical protein
MFGFGAHMDEAIRVNTGRTSVQKSAASLNLLHGSSPVNARRELLPNFIRNQSRGGIQFSFDALSVGEVYYLELLQKDRPALLTSLPAYFGKPCLVVIRRSIDSGELKTQVHLSNTEADLLVWDSAKAM